MTTVTTSPNYGGIISDIKVDCSYVYYGGDTTQTVKKANVSDFTTVATSPSYGGNLRAIEVDGSYVYYGGLTTQKVVKSNAIRLSELVAYQKEV